MPQVTFLPSAEAIALAEKVSKYIVKVGSLSKDSPWLNIMKLTSSASN